MGDGSDLRAMRLQGRLGGRPRGRRHGFDRHHVAVAAGQDVVHGAFEDELASVHDGHAVADLLDLAESRADSKSDNMSAIAFNWGGKVSGNKR